MTAMQSTLVASAFVLILGIALPAQFGWIRGALQTRAAFVCGVAAIACLWTANIPPDWFAGSREGFAIGATVSASAFLYRRADERAFGLPLLLGLGLTLLVANLVAFVRGVL